MAQTGFTPILLYSSSTAAAAPTAGNLTNSTLGSELAINIADGKLFYKDSGGSIQVIAWKTTPTTAGGTGLTSYTAGDLVYYATGTTFTKLAIGTAYQALQVNAGATAPSWQPSATSVLTTQGDLLYASAANTLARLAKNTTATRYLANTGSNNNPAWDQINLSNGVTNTLAIGNGGTGLTSYTANRILYATATNTLGTSAKLTFDGTTFALAGASATQTETGYNTATWVLDVTQTENNSYQRFKCTINFAGTEALVKVSISSEPNSGIGWAGSSVGYFVIRRNTGGAIVDTIQINNYATGFRLMTPEVSGNDVLFGLNTSNNGTGTTMGATVLVEVTSRSPGTGEFTWASIAAGTAAGGSVYGNTLFVNNAAILSPGTYSNTVGATNRDVYVDSTGYLGYVSSTRESKTNINALQDVDWLMDLEPVTFNRKVINKNRELPTDPMYLDAAYEELEYGLIADDVEKVNKELVFYDITESGPVLRGLNYSKLITPMLKKIQQLTNQVNELKAKIG